MGQYSIVIADDDHDLTQALAARCQRLGLRVCSAHTALDALNLIHDVKPNLICLDVNMPFGNGLTVCEMIAAEPQLATIPVIIMTGDAAPETIRRCHNLCAFYIEKCSDVWPRLEPLIWDLLVDLGESSVPERSERRLTNASDCKPSPVRIDATPIAVPAATVPMATVPTVTVPTLVSNESCAPWANDPVDQECLEYTDVEAKLAVEDDLEYCELPSDQRLADLVFGILGADPRFLERTPQAPKADEPPWVLCIDDDADYTAALKLRLESYGVAVIRAFEGMEGYRFAFARPADLILLDFEMPNGQGDYILGKLKGNPITKDIPVIVITGRKDRALQRKMMSMGAANFMHKPPDFNELLKELRKHIDVLPQPA